MPKLEIEISAKDNASGVLRNIGDVAKTTLGVFAGQMLMGGLQAGLDALGSGLRSLSDFAQGSLDMAMDYEASLNLMQAVSGATGEQMKRVAETAFDLGADMSLPATSAADAAFAMTELSKAGFDTERAMSAAKGVLQLATAGMIEEGQAAKITAGVLNAFNLAGSESTTVANLLAAASNASSAEVRDLALSLQMSSAVFALAGIPVQDLVASISQMANAGIIGSDAGTSLKQMMLQLETPTKKAAGLMDSLGLEVYDAQGKMRPFRDLIAQFTKTLGGATQEERDFALGTIFGSDAVRAASVVMLGGVEAHDKMLAAVERQNAAQELSDAKTKGLRGAWLGLQSQIETVRLAAFVPLLPVLEDIVRVIVGGAGSLTDGAAKLGEAVGVKLRGAFAWIQAEAIPYVQALYANFQEGGLPELADALRASFGRLWTNSIWPEISTWPVRFWGWLTGPGGALDLASGQLGKLSRAILTWSLDKDTQDDLRLTGAMLTDTVLGQFGDSMAMAQEGQGAVGRFVVGLVELFASMTFAIEAIGISVGEGIMLGLIAKVGSKETTDALAGALNGLIKNVNDRLNPLHLALEAAGNILGFAAGGIVPGALGAPMLAVVHGGEVITPAGQMVNNYNYFNQTINTRATTDDTARGFYMMQYLARAYQ